MWQLPLDSNYAIVKELFKPDASVPPVVEIVAQKFRYLPMSW